MIILIAFAFLGGVVTILSPCILPILPIILTGSVGGGKNKPYGIVTGFVLSFTFFTLFLTTIVNLTGLSADFMRNLAVLILILFGFSLIIPQIQVRIEALFTRFVPKNSEKKQRHGFGGGILIGLSLGLLWTPCVGPILASVISLALTGSVNGSAFIITLAYALGTALPMLLIMYGGREALNRIPWLTHNLGKIQKTFGVIMIIVGVLIFFNIDRKFQAYILETFPNYGTGLTSFESNDDVLENLDKLDEQSGIENNNQALQLAPEIIVGGEWLNSEPLTLSSLRGKVVLIDFMTYSCINCIRTFPYLNDWYDKYKDQGLVVIGIHTPEFEFEKNASNVANALKDYDIEFPVVQDNNYETWRAYSNRYWPHTFIINHRGQIVYDHIGEGEYDKTESKIQELIKEKNEALGMKSPELGDISPVSKESFSPRSPEIYFGSARNSRLGNGVPGQRGVVNFTYPEQIEDNVLYLVGRWNIQPEYAEAASSDAKVIFNYTAKDVFIVAGSDQENKIFIKHDAEELGEPIMVKDEQLYTVRENEKNEEHRLELKIDEPGLRLFTFTFG